MSITESDLQTIRDLFMDAAAQLLKEERAVVEGRIDGRLEKIEGMLSKIEERLGNIEEDVEKIGHVQAEMNVEVAKLNLASKIDIARKVKQG